MKDQPATKTLYHGSPKAPGKIPFGTPKNRIPQISPGKPFFVTSDLNYATRFARGGVVSAVRMNTESVVDFHDQEVLDRMLATYNSDPKILGGVTGPWDDDLDGDISESAYQLLESPAVMEQLRSEGCQAVFIPEDIELNVTSFAILDPACVEFSHLVSSPASNREPEFGL